MEKVFDREENCCGCSACMNVCAQHAITMEENAYGFVYPRINTEKCVDCGLCKATCDFQKKDGVEMREPIKAFAAVHSNNKELVNSASGGAFFSIAQYVIREGGFVFGCKYDNDLNPVHACAVNDTEICEMQSSKYVQSRMGFVYREVKEKLKSGKLVLFSGTPCQVAGLLSFLGNRQYDNLITMDLVCHGTPSANVWQQHLKYIENKYGSKIKAVNFRSKKQGWGEMMLELTLADEKKKYQVAFEDCYYRNFLLGNINRPSAYVCKYATNKRVSDISIGDFWGHQNSKYSLDFSFGMSVCLANTEKGLDVLGKGKLQMEEIPVQHVVEGNEQLRKATDKGPDWEECMSLLKENKYDEIIRIHESRYKKVVLKARIKRMVPKGLMKIIRKNLNSIRKK